MDISSKGIIEYQWNVNGPIMEYVNEILMQCSWNHNGISMEYEWNSDGI